MHEYGVTLERFDDLPRADAVVAAVAHRECKGLSVKGLGKKMVKGGAFIDVKAVFDPAALAAAGLKMRRLQSSQLRGCRDFVSSAPSSPNRVAKLKRAPGQVRDGFVAGIGTRLT